MKLVIANEKQITQMDLDSTILKPNQPIYRFAFTSLLVHIITASAVLMLRPTPQPKPDVIEIEIGAGETATVTSAPLITPQIQEAAPAPETKATEALTKAQPSTLPEKKISTSAPQKVEVLPVAAVEASPSEPVIPLATLEDIETPALAEIPEELSPTVSQSEVIAQVEQQAEAAKNAEAEQLALAQEEVKNNDSDIQAQAAKAEQQLAEQSAQARAEAMEKANQARVQAEAKALADARAEAEAQALADSQANTNQGQAGLGADAQTSAPAETTGELRSLAQLRQMPGNPRPQYEPQERLKGHNGAVIFKAFVTNDGKLTNFKMIQSTGYKNLDFKTLKALKQWKFYPGQEGWVELPFQWDLKGGPQEMPTLLRRRVGQN